MILARDKISYQHGDAADALGISPLTLARWRNEGIIGSVKVRGLRLYPKSELERLIRLDDAALGPRGGGVSEKIAHAVASLSQSGRGKAAMRNLLAMLDNGATSLDQNGKAAITFLMNEAFAGQVGSTLDAMREAIITDDDAEEKIELIVEAAAAKILSGVVRSDRIATLNLPCRCSVLHSNAQRQGRPDFGVIMIVQLAVQHPPAQVARLIQMWDNKCVEFQDDVSQIDISQSNYDERVEEDWRSTHEPYDGSEYRATATRSGFSFARLCGHIGTAIEQYLVGDATEFHLLRQRAVNEIRELKSRCTEDWSTSQSPKDRYKCLRRASQLTKELFKSGEAEVDFSFDDAAINRMENLVRRLKVRITAAAPLMAQPTTSRIEMEDKITMAIVTKKITPK